MYICGFRYGAEKMKERITITMNSELLAWLDEKVDQKIFANRSHGLEYLIAEKQREEKFGKPVKNDW